jgi:hypothetical protein
MKLDRLWCLVVSDEGEHDSVLTEIDALKRGRAIELVRNMGLQVERRWTVELDSASQRALDAVMAVFRTLRPDSNGSDLVEVCGVKMQPRCVRCVLASAVVIGLSVLGVEADDLLDEQRRDDGKASSAN